MKKASLAPPPVPAGTAAQRLSAITASLAASAKGGGHAPPALVAVSKTHPAGHIRPLLDAGHRMFGENRVQEAAAKWPALREHYAGIALHLVGQLQSNKAADAVALFDAIHSLDRSSLVRALAQAVMAAGRQPLLFVQVNVGEEAQKGGVQIAGLPALLAEASAAGLKVSGLMAVPPAAREPAPYFALLAKLAQDHGLPLLSMGMSADHDIAAALGSTHVRIGSALFGERETGPESERRLIP